MRRELSFLVGFIKAYFRKGRFNPSEIPRLSIETTNMCDAQCVFCVNKFMQRYPQHLDMHLFKKAVDDFISMQGTRIDFNTTIGEPLLDPYLLERARYVRRFKQIGPLGFVTNLQWLHKFNIDEFYASGFTWLGISTVLSGREKYLAFFGVDRYEQVIKNILKLLEENKKQKNKLALRFSIKPTDEPISAVINHPDFKKINSLSQWDLVEQVKRQTFICDDWLGFVKLPPYLKRRPLYPRLFRPCQILFDSLVVYSNGDIGACGCRNFEADSELTLGNIRDTTIQESWKSSKLSDIRYGWLKINKIPQICTRCTHYVY